MIVWVVVAVLASCPSQPVSQLKLLSKPSVASAPPRTPFPGDETVTDLEILTAMVNECDHDFELVKERLSVVLRSEDPLSLLFTSHPSVAAALFPEDFVVFLLIGESYMISSSSDFTTVFFL